MNAGWWPEQTRHPASGRLGLFGLPRLTRYRLCHPRWPGPPLRIAVIADAHVNWPWTPLTVISGIVRQVQGLGADLIVLAGDMLPDRYMPCRHVSAAEIVPLFASLSAPLGVWSVMGNHDYLDDPGAVASDGKLSEVARELAAARIPLLRNRAVPLRHGGTFWLVGLDSQKGRGKRLRGHDDMGAAFAAVPEGAPAILLAHEPDCFPTADPRALLQISGHTHGGQFVLFGRRPMTPSDWGDRYAIGHHRQDERHLVVSVGLGYSGLPLRLGVPPEVVLIEVGHGESQGGKP